jgi:hypothetical protein
MPGASGVGALCPALLRSVNAFETANHATHPLVRIPVWLTFGIAALVIIFGSYRIYLATRPAPAEGEAEAQPPRRGLYAMSKRMHLFVGIIYLLLGAGLIATSLGFNPWGDSMGPDTERPSKDKAPTKTGVPVDQIPKK